MPFPQGVAEEQSKDVPRALTDDETKTYMIGVLKNLATTRPKSKWPEHHRFFCANQSGDLATMNPAIKALCEKIVKKVRRRAR